MAPFPPVRAAARRRRPHRARRPAAAAAHAAAARSAASARSTSGATRAQLLLAGNALHADVPPDAPPSGFLGWLLASLAPGRRLPDARRRGRRAHGRAGPPAAIGRRSPGLRRRGRPGGGGGRAGRGGRGRRDPGAGPTCGARRRRRRRPAAGAWSASSTCPAASWPPSPASSAAGRRSRSTGRCGPPSRGATGRWRRAGTVHLAESIDELALQAAAVSGARIPDDPFVVLGQMTTADPTRSPAGTESAWAYTHVPFHVRDGGGATADHRGRGRAASSPASRSGSRRTPPASVGRSSPGTCCRPPDSSSATPTSSRATTPAAPTSCTNNWSSDRSRASAARRRRSAASTSRRRRPTPAVGSTAPAGRTQPGPRWRRTVSAASCPASPPADRPSAPTGYERRCTSTMPASSCSS